MAKFLCNVISYTLKRTVDITVVIPTPTCPDSMRRPKAAEPCVHTPKAPYPVVYLLHGMGNNNATWTGYTNVELYAEERQIAIVNIAAENKSYIKRGGDDFIKFISEELPDFVTGIFPVSKRPEDTFIAGLSMGGYGTLVHALSFPERYAAFGAFSAGIRHVPRPADYDFDKRGETRRPYPENPVVEPQFDPPTLAHQLAARGGKFPKAYMACGGKDFLMDDDRRFRDELRDLGADVTWDEMEQYGHEWRFWDIEIEKFLDWIPRTDFYAQAGRRQI